MRGCLAPSLLQRGIPLNRPISGVRTHLLTISQTEIQCTWRPTRLSRDPARSRVAGQSAQRITGDHHEVRVQDLSDRNICPRAHLDAAEFLALIAFGDDDCGCIRNGGGRDNLESCELFGILFPQEQVVSIIRPVDLPEAIVE